MTNKPIIKAIGFDVYGVLLPSSDDRLLNLVDNLRHNGYKTGILSNTGSIYEVSDKHRRIFDHFDEILLSHEVDVWKPEAAAYKLLADRLGVEFGELVYIDDSRMNIAAACQLGIHGIYFETYEKLLKDLKVFNELF